MPLLVSHPDTDNVIILWVHNDGNGKYQYSIGHFSGMKPKTVEEYVISEPV